jgi:hypothetical protein
MNISLNKEEEAYSGQCRLLCMLFSSSHFIDSEYSTSNHPIISQDGLLQVFLSEPSFESWRKGTAVSLEEESASKKIDRVEEMSVPSDLEDKVA